MDDGFATGFLAGQDSGGNNGGMLGNDGWWGIILLALLFGWGGNRGGIGGGGGGNGCCCGSPCATQADVRAAVDQQTLISKLDQQTYGLADSTYALNNTITNGFHGVDNAVCNLGFNMQTGFNSLSAQLAQCCCDNRAAIADVKYQMATDTCALGNTIQNTTRDITDTIRDGFARMEAQANARYTAELERKLNACDRDSALQGLSTYLINTLRPSPIPAYVSCNPWAGCGGNWNGCNCGC